MPSQDLHDRQCDHTECSKPATKTCAKCHCVYYCSRSCQKGHYKAHRKDCGNLDTARQTAQEARTEARRMFDQARTEHRQQELVQLRAQHQEAGFIREFDEDQETEAFVKSGGIIGQGEANGVSAPRNDITARVDRYDNHNSGLSTLVPGDEIEILQIPHQGERTTYEILYRPVQSDQSDSEGRVIDLEDAVEETDQAG